MVITVTLARETEGRRPMTRGNHAGGAGEPAGEGDCTSDQ